MARTEVFAGARDGARVGNHGAFYAHSGSVYKWSPEQSRYVYSPRHRICLCCLAIIEVPRAEACPLCGGRDGDAWSEA